MYRSRSWGRRAPNHRPYNLAWNQQPGTASIFCLANSAPGPTQGANGAGVQPAPSCESSVWAQKTGGGVGSRKGRVTFTPNTLPCSGAAFRGSVGVDVLM